MYFLKLHPNIRFRLMTIFLITLTSNMVFPFMAIYFAKKIGAGQASLFLSIAIILNFVSSIWGGNFADKVGRKKVMVISEVLRLGTFIMFAVSNSPWFDWPYMTLLFFMINNICSGLYSPASEAMLLDVSTPDDRKYMYSIIYWISNLSIALGGTIGAIFFNHYLFELFVILSISSIISTIITMFFMSETYFPDRDKGEKTAASKKGAELFELFRNYKMVIKDKIFIVFVVSSMLMFSLETHLTNFISVRLEDKVDEQALFPFNFKIDGIELLGILRAENTICVVVLSLVVTWFIRKMNEKTLIFGGFSLYIVGYGILSYSTTPWILFIFMVFAVLGEVMAFPAHQSFLGDIVPDNLRSSYLAMNRVALKGSSLIGSIGIYLASVLPGYLLSSLVWLSGIIALWLFYLVLPAIYGRRVKSQNTLDVKTM